MNAVVQFQAPRLPYHPAVEQRFGVDQGGWRVLTDAVFPAAESPESIVMALAYCRARNLDIFKKPVQIVPIWDKKRSRMVDTVWPGIAELRTTAMRTGSFAGFDETEFGPMVEAELSGVKVSHPEWAQCVVYRLVAGQRVAFIGPKVYWIETYATAKKDSKAPNTMWAKRPRGQLEKCAEAAALRRAFPEEIGNDIAAEEISPYSSVRDVTEREGPNLAARLAGPAEPATEGFTAHHALDPDDHIPAFDTAPPVLETSAPATVADEAVKAGADEGFTGRMAGEGAAESPEADHADDEKGSAAFDHIAWADRFIADLPFLTLEQLDALESNKLELARFAQLQAISVDKAKEFEDALKDARAAFQ